jgi:hypothetical protein
MQDAMVEDFLNQPSPPTVSHDKTWTLKTGFLVLLLCLGGIAFNTWMAFQNRSEWHLDFIQFYSAGKLAGTGHLYDWGALQLVETQHGGRPVPTGRLPAFAGGYKVIASLPVEWARWTWFAFSVFAIAATVCIWPDRRLRLWMCIAFSWSLPLAVLLALGQDTPFFMLAFALGGRFLAGRKDFSAGLMFSLCAIKFHLAAGIVVLVLARRRGRAVLGGVVGLSGLWAISSLIEGMNWPARWLQMSGLPEFDPAFERMPNLRGLLFWVSSSLPLETVTALAAMLVAWKICRRLPSANASALTLSTGVLVGHHGYTSDAILMIPLIAHMLETKPSGLIFGWAVLMITPAPYLALLSDYPIIGQSLIVGFALTAMLQMRTPLPEMNQLQSR